MHGAVVLGEAVLSEATLSDQSDTAAAIWANQTVQLINDTLRDGGENLMGLVTKKGETGIEDTVREKPCTHLMWPSNILFSLTLSCSLSLSLSSLSLLSLSLCPLSLCLSLTGVVFNTLRSRRFLAPFFATLQRSRPASSPAPITVMSLYVSFADTLIPQLVSATHVQPIDQSDLNGHFAAAPYLASVTTPASKAFQASYAAMFGNSSSSSSSSCCSCSCSYSSSSSSLFINHQMEAMYTAVKAYASAIAAAGSFNVDLIRAAMYGLGFSTPAGRISFATDHHASRHLFMEHVQPAWQGSSSAFKPSLVHSTTKARAALPFNPLDAQSVGVLCDWSANKETGLVHVDVLPVGLLMRVKAGTYALCDRVRVVLRFCFVLGGVWVWVCGCVGVWVFLRVGVGVSVCGCGGGGVGVCGGVGVLSLCVNSHVSRPADALSMNECPCANGMNASVYECV